MRNTKTIYKAQIFPNGVHLIAQSWNPGLEEVETQGGNGRAKEGESVLKSVAFVEK